MPDPLLAIEQRLAQATPTHSECKQLVQDGRFLLARLKAAEVVCEAYKQVCDPEEEGFCSCTMGQMPLVNDGMRYVRKHAQGCWYGDLRIALTTWQQAKGRDE